MIIKLGRVYDPKAAKRVLETRQTRQSYKKPPSPALRAALEASGGRVTAAAAALGVHRATFYRWLLNDSELAAAARSVHRQLAETVVDEAGR